MDRSIERTTAQTPSPVRRIDTPPSPARYAPRRTGTGYGRSSGWARDRQYAANGHRELMSVR
ncbi:MAG: hypothetical protein U0S76_00665 [Pseudoxanthomonas sp.]|nr:hypothetical protein [Pseudoxanthomonas sp.]